MSTLYTHSNANREIQRGDGHGQQRILPPTTCSNFSSSIKVGLRPLDANKNKSSHSSLNPVRPLGVESVSTQQGSTMKRTESEVISHSGEMDHDRGVPRTYEETSSEADILALVNALLFPEEQKQQHDEEEVGVGPQKKCKQNISTGKAALSLSTGEERTPVLENVVVPQASGDVSTSGRSKNCRNDPPVIEDSNMKGGTDIIMDKTTMIVTKFSSDLKNLETLNSTVKTVENEYCVVGEKMDELSMSIPDDPPVIEDSNMKGGTDMIMDKTTTIVTKFNSDSEEDQTEVKNRETLKSSHSQTKWKDLRGEGREWHVEKQRLSWDVRKIIVLFPLFSLFSIIYY